MSVSPEYVEEKIESYEVAIAALRAQESESDTPLSKPMREKLANKLDKECQRWLENCNEKV